MVALLDPGEGERILDLGCGDGVLTAEIAAVGAAVVGVDASAEQVAAARDRGLDARVADGNTLEFDAEFDAVFSNAALHWMTSPDQVIAGVWRALVPGGRFVGEFGGEGNVETVRAALIAALDRRGLDGAAVDPWFFPGVEGYAAMLRAVGFEVRSCRLIPRWTPIPGALGDWIETLAQTFLHKVRETERETVKEEVEAAAADLLRASDGTWAVDYVRLRFHAVKPGLS